MFYKKELNLRACIASTCVCVCLTHPEVDAHGGDEAAGQEGSIFETHQQAALPDAGVSNQHHLNATQSGGGEIELSGKTEGAENRYNQRCVG